MAISALGEANVDMRAKIKVGAVKEKCQVSSRTGGWGDAQVVPAHSDPGSRMAWQYEKGV